jgi:hypothetical protein
MGALSRCASSVGNSHGDTGTDRLCTVEAVVGSFYVRLPEVSNLYYCECRIETNLVILCAVSVTSVVFIARYYRGVIPIC